MSNEAATSIRNFDGMYLSLEPLPIDDLESSAPVSHRPAIPQMNLRQVQIANSAAIWTMPYRGRSLKVQPDIVDGDETDQENGTSHE
jgi:hypothetical protein